MLQAAETANEVLPFLLKARGLLLSPVDYRKRPCC
jgi:hypothetical protein